MPDLWQLEEPGSQDWKGGVNRHRVRNQHGPGENSEVSGLAAPRPGPAEHSKLQEETWRMSRARLSSDACRSSGSQGRHLRLHPGPSSLSVFSSPLPVHHRGGSILWGRDCGPDTGSKVKELDLNQMI